MENLKHIKLFLMDMDGTVYVGDKKIAGAFEALETIRQSGTKVLFLTNNSGHTPKELKQKLMESLESLTEKEKQVILLYYYEELTLKEISYALEVSESRVSQLHTKALSKMREKLGRYMGILLESK